MYRSLMLIVLLSAGCQSDKKQTSENESEAIDTITATPPLARPAVYANERFRNVVVEKGTGGVYTISGQAQIFEANFSWVIEDGHNELQSGHQMTDAGASAWGNFRFSVDAAKERQNSTLHLILFESSAMDGSRQHQLPVPLP